MLKKWRIQKNLNGPQAAAFLGLTSPSQLFYIERGLTFPTPETIAKIEAATEGAITVADHWRAWRIAHPKEFKQFHAAGRAAAKAYRKTGNRS